MEDSSSLSSAYSAASLTMSLPPIISWRSVNSAKNFRRRASSSFCPSGPVLVPSGMLARLPAKNRSSSPLPDASSLVFMDCCLFENLLLRSASDFLTDFRARLIEDSILKRFLIMDMLGHVRERPTSMTYAIRLASGFATMYSQSNMSVFG